MFKKLLFWHSFSRSKIHYSDVLSIVQKIIILMFFQSFKKSLFCYSFNRSKQSLFWCSFNHSKNHFSGLLSVVAKRSLHCFSFNASAKNHYFLISLTFSSLLLNSAPCLSFILQTFTHWQIKKKCTLLQILIYTLRKIHFTWKVLLNSNVHLKISSSISLSVQSRFLVSLPWSISSNTTSCSSV